MKTLHLHVISVLYVYDHKTQFAFKLVVFSCVKIFRNDRQHIIYIQLLKLPASACANKLWVSPLQSVLKHPFSFASSSLFFCFFSM